MKLPISFGNRLFFRIILPGSVVTAALTPLSLQVIEPANFGLNIPLLLSLAIVSFGTAFLVLDMPIYMLFEGRRFWPKALFTFGMKRERARLLRVHRTMRRNDVSRSRSQFSLRGKQVADMRYLECAVDLNGFPLHRVTLMPVVCWPTRLGNLIASYEQYPRIKYGLDAVFFWPRLWVSIDKDLRAEIDNQQSLADGLLYLSASLIVASVLFLLYVIGSACNLGAAIKIGPAASSVLSAASALAAFFVYRISLYSHIQYGEAFKAVFDQHRCLLKLDDVVDFVSRIASDKGLRDRSYVDKNIAVWRFLRWHRVRLPKRVTNQRVRLP